MNREEALIFLPVDEDWDAQDLYEEKLFELKQFFLTRFPMSKLINSRLSRFEKIEEAYQVLGGEIPEFMNGQSMNYPVFDSIHEAHSWYNREKNVIRLQLSSAKSLNEVTHVLNEYILITRHYSEKWNVPVNENDKSMIKVGAEPDPMEIQSALNALSDVKKLDSEYILTLPDENCLKSEAKRLSLWLNFESNE